MWSFWLPSNVSELLKANSGHFIPWIFLLSFLIGLLCTWPFVAILGSHGVKQLSMIVFNKFLWAKKLIILGELGVRSAQDSLSSRVFQWTPRQGMEFGTSSYPDQPFSVIARLLIFTVIIVCWPSGTLQSWIEGMGIWTAEVLQSCCSYQDSAIFLE